MFVLVLSGCQISRWSWADTDRVGNDLVMVRRVFGRLQAHGLRCWLFGGWAEEIRGMRAPGAHRDIDLLYPASDFAAFAPVLADGREIVGKRLPHKRAFLAGTVLVEVFLVDCDDRGLHPSFWGRIRHDWPGDTLCSADTFEWPVASAAALACYRRSHRRLMGGHP